MPGSGQRWTEEEVTLALGLYLQISFNKIDKNGKDVIELARMLDRTPSSVTYKMYNLAFFDPAVKKDGKKTFDHHSKIDEAVWNKYCSRPHELAPDCEKIIDKYCSERTDCKPLFSDYVLGGEIHIETKARMNQNIFRRRVLTEYNETCCVTGIHSSEFLIASHIKPWKDSSDVEKIDHRNGLCLNPLHDKAFDKGLMTIDPKYHTVIYVDDIEEMMPRQIYNDYFGRYENKTISEPEHDCPNRDYIEFHNKHVFTGRV
ncbi:MAG: HNH endonuclease [Candidatus Methanomethylophilaceae archaeon]